jgi:hypothetical protein
VATFHEQPWGISASGVIARRLDGEEVIVRGRQRLRNPRQEITRRLTDLIVHRVA